MKNRTLLIDGNYLLKRSFEGGKSTFTQSFGQISGLYGFLTKLRKLIKDYKINKVIVCWDGQNGGVLRHRLSSDYKSTRKNKEWYSQIEMSEAEIKREEEKSKSILSNRKRTQAYLEEIFVRQLEILEVEADDLIAKYCIDHNNTEEIHIFTNDRDFSQLLDLNITIIFSNIEQPVTKSNYFFNFGYHYSNALTMKIICGDVSDNIKGIDGLKEPTLLKYFPEMQFKHFSVKDVCQKAAELNKERVSKKLKPLKAFENLLNNVERLKLNHKLINLKEPFLNEQALNELEQLEMPLSPENRGSKNLYKMMVEDEFLTVYGSTFVNYIEPFYTVIMNEKQLLTEYYKNSKTKL